MGYYIRYFVTDDTSIDLPMLNEQLSKVDPAFSINTFPENRQAGEVIYDREIIGRVEINQRGDDLFKDELVEMSDEILEMKGDGKNLVSRTLNNAKTVIAVQVLFGENRTDQILMKLDPLWNWLFANRTGLLQVDGEGYYDKKRLVLRV